MRIKYLRWLELTWFNELRRSKFRHDQLARQHRNNWLISLFTPAPTDRNNRFGFVSFWTASKLLYLWPCVDTKQFDCWRHQERLNFMDKMTFNLKVNISQPFLSYSCGGSHTFSRIFQWEFLWCCFPFFSQIKFFFSLTLIQFVVLL